jgi:hypothetical protein
MGFDPTVSGEEKRSPGPRGGEGDEKVVVDWVGVPSKMGPSRMDGLGIDDGTETGEGVYEEIRSPKAVERGGPDWVPSHGDRKSGVYEEGTMEDEDLPRSSTLPRLSSQTQSPGTESKEDPRGEGCTRTIDLSHGTTRSDSGEGTILRSLFPIGFGFKWSKSGRKV